MGGVFRSKLWSSQIWSFPKWGGGGILVFNSRKGYSGKFGPKFTVQPETCLCITVVFYILRMWRLMTHRNISKNHVALIVWTSLYTDYQHQCFRVTNNIVVAKLLRFLVSTHVVCERLTVMYYIFQLQAFLVQNSLSATTQVFQECWSGVPLPLPLPPLPFPSPNRVLRRLYVETNFCIPRRYHLV